MGWLPELIKLIGFVLVYRWDGYIASNMSWSVMDLSQTRGWADIGPHLKRPHSVLVIQLHGPGRQTAVDPGIPQRDPTSLPQKPVVSSNPWKKRGLRFLKNLQNTFYLMKKI